METSSGETTPKRHSRHGSSGRALPRRSTRGPLDASEAPIPVSHPLNTPSHLPHQSSSLLSPTASQYMTPRLPSPQPGSNLSGHSLSPSFRTARTSLSPSPSGLSGNGSQKDFSFLLRPEIYHPITLLDVPPPFRASSSQPSPNTPLPELISTGHFRSAAIAASQSILSPTLSPSSHAEIFSLIYTRLSCLTLCNQTALAAQEVKALEDLNSSYYRDDVTGDHLCPWELRVLAVRLQGMGFNDARRGVMGYYDLAREARLTLTTLKKSRSNDPTIEDIEESIRMWEQRLEELGIRVASALIEMEDLEGATRFLATLKPSPSSTGLGMQKALLWLCLGDVDKARSSISEEGQEKGSDAQIIMALAHMADSDFEKAVGVWEELIDSDTAPEEEKAMYQQNLAVSYLYLGRMEESRTTLTSLISNHHSFHALTFNLSTLYELCTERSRALKISLAEKVAQIQEEEGEKRGWEKVNGDFKL